MGVHGLWRLIEPSGKPVPLETLENKVLAIDVSIWLHQAIKGFQDAKGAPVANAHLLGIYHRICKLLYFRVKPVFVFDGGVPVLKKQTIAKRNQSKLKNKSEADRLHKDLLSSLLKHSAISKVLSDKAIAAIESSSPTKKNDGQNDLYYLPPTELDSTVSSDDEESTSESSPSKQYDLHSIDTKSAKFQALPVEVRHEILTDLKETRKQSSWGRIHELPRQSDHFSNYQMERLLKRQSVQSALEEAEKEMGGHSLSLGELEKLLNDQGVITKRENVGKRIASDENTRFLLIKNVREAIEEIKNKTKLATVQENPSENEDTSKINNLEVEDNNKIDNRDENSTEEQKFKEVETVKVNKNEENVENINNKIKNKADQELEDDLQKAIALSLQNEPSTSKKLEEMSFLQDFSAADFAVSDSSDEELPIVGNRLASAQNYMMEYSGLTPNEIAKIISGQDGNEKLSRNIKKDVVNKNVENVGISDSDSSSNCEDFLDVEEEKKENKCEAMEVVIKPDEEIEDDLFEDIFVDKKKICEELGLEKGKNEKISGELSVQVEKVEEKLKIVKELSLEKEKPEKNGKILDEFCLEKEKIEDKIIENSEKKLVEDKEVEKSVVNVKKIELERPKLSIEELGKMQENLKEEQAQLVAERHHKERMATNITDQMYQEAQELLELFGVPYLTAPMEAEAQCAFLELINLTNGTITDDSDIWLFGGQTVYKNFFNQTKHVLEYKLENIQHHFKLTREQMILLAMLVGSDYTTGLTGVGPVTALEILAAFPPKTQLLSGLNEFKSWFIKGKVIGPKRISLRNKLKNVQITENFPNPQIVQAYLEPTVETSEEKFSWGKPDVIGLIDFAKRKFGWTIKKTEEILNPVLKRMEDRTNQKRIEDYFKKNLKVDSGLVETKMSKRVKTAIGRIGNQDEKEEDDEEKPKIKKKRIREKKIEDEDIEVLKKTKVESKKRIKEIETEMRKVLEEKPKPVDLHKKDIIPQKQKDKSVMLRNKLKAIETFRKSKKGPGFVNKRKIEKKTVKEDAGYLSESSSD